MHEKHQKRLFWAIVLSETSHIFCCVLPTVISLASLLAGFGLIVTLPAWMQSLHDALHHWEPEMIAFSVSVVLLGWGLHFYNERHECCHHSGCHHEPCGPRKRRADKILIVASLLMVFNLFMYFGVHRPMEAARHAHEHTEVTGHDHEDHDGHED